MGGANEFSGAKLLKVFTVSPLCSAAPSISTSEPDKGAVSFGLAVGDLLPKDVTAEILCRKLSYIDAAEVLNVDLEVGESAVDSVHYYNSRYQSVARPRTRNLLSLFVTHASPLALILRSF
jgi:hypothetical protein